MQATNASTLTGPPASKPTETRNPNTANPPHASVGHHTVIGPQKEPLVASECYRPRMKHLLLLLGATALCLGGAVASGQAAGTGQPDDPEAGQEPDFVAPTRPDRIGRIMAPVYVNGRGPFAFVIDTGASRSAIAPHVAAELGLVPDPEHLLSVRGVTGTAVVPSVAIDRLQAGEMVLKHQVLPIIEPSVFANADGILGVEGLKNACLQVNFIDESIAITRNGCPRSSKGWPRVSATLRFGRLVVVKGRFDRTKVQAIIDTGAARSLGNQALLQALELERQAEQPLSAREVLGATEQRIAGSMIGAPPLYLGEVKVADIEVTYGDFEVFRLWNLEDVPAVLVGMDVLGTADALMIDYRRSELLIVPPGTMQDPVVRHETWPSRIR